MVEGWRGDWCGPVDGWRRDVLSRAGPSRACRAGVARAAQDRPRLPHCIPAASHCAVSHAPHPTAPCLTHRIALRRVSRTASHCAVSHAPHRTASPAPCPTGGTRAAMHRAAPGRVGGSRLSRTRSGSGRWRVESRAVFDPALDGTRRLRDHRRAGLRWLCRGQQDSAREARGRWHTRRAAEHRSARSAG